MDLSHDVLYLIFEKLCLNELLQLRLVSKRIKVIAESIPGLVDIISSSWFNRFKILQNEHLGIEYKGYSKVILNENYKYIAAINYILHAQTYGFAVKAGIVYSTDRWETTKWIVGEDIRKNKHPILVQDPRPEMNRKGKYSHKKENNWFYDNSLDGWITETSQVSFKITFNVFPGFYMKRECWFALFVEDMHGNRYWNNNNGWNYDLEHSKMLSCDSSRGWTGT